MVELRRKLSMDASISPDIHGNISEPEPSKSWGMKELGTHLSLLFSKLPRSAQLTMVAICLMLTMNACSPQGHAVEITRDKGSVAGLYDGSLERSDRSGTFREDGENRAEFEISMVDGLGNKPIFVVENTLFAAGLFELPEEFGRDMPVIFKYGKSVRDSRVGKDVIPSLVVPANEFRAFREGAGTKRWYGEIPKPIIWRMEIDQAIQNQTGDPESDIVHFGLYRKPGPINSEDRIGQITYKKGEVYYVMGVISSPNDVTFHNGVDIPTEKNDSNSLNRPKYFSQGGAIFDLRKVWAWVDGERTEVVEATCVGFALDWTLFTPFDGPDFDYSN
jgi:hypothetical protein